MTPRADASREFATDVVRQLRAAGHVAFWAGGCVRDLLLGRAAKDFDVATSSPYRINAASAFWCGVAFLAIGR